MPGQPLPFDPIAEARRQWSEHGWGEVAPAMAVVTSIMRLQQVLLSKGDAALRPFGLTFARYEVLMLRRSPRSEFVAGVYVFPGGAVDPADRRAGSRTNQAAAHRTLPRIVGVGATGHTNHKSKPDGCRFETASRHFVKLRTMRRQQERQR